MLLLFAFVCGLLMDAIWSICVDAVTHKKPILAANMSVVLYLCTLVSTVLIVEKRFEAVAAYIIGGWIGTYIVVKHAKSN